MHNKDSTSGLLIKMWNSFSNSITNLFVFVVVVVLCVCVCVFVCVCVCVCACVRA